MTAVAGILFVLLVLAAGTVVLQVFLSNKENKWLGLILPIITLCLSLMSAFSIAGLAEFTQSSPIAIEENGVFRQEVAPQTFSATLVRWGVPALSLAGCFFLLYNIPTVVFGAIYFACRVGQRKRRALEKMRALDLE